MDLYACPITGTIFNIYSAKIDIEKRSSRSAKQFFCPSCPKSPIILSPSPPELQLTCPTCKWDARSIGIYTVAELLERDGDPYPWISTSVRALIQKAKAFSSDSSQDIPEVGDAIGRSKSFHRANSMHILRMRKSIASIERKTQVDHQTPENASDRALRFTKEQDKKERSLFKQWMPPDSPVGKNEQPDENIEDLAGAKLEELIDLEDRVCSTTRRKRDATARRRVPNPKVIVRSPFHASYPPAVSLAKFAPEISVEMLYRSENTGQDNSDICDLVLNVRNVMSDSQLHVDIENPVCLEGKTSATVGAGDVGKIHLSSFPLQTKAVPDVVYGGGKVGEKLAVVDLVFLLTGVSRPKDRWIEEHRWQVRMYSRHQQPIKKV